MMSGKSLKEAAEEARKGMEKTKTMTVARAGRAQYLNQKDLEGVADPGAMAVFVVFEALEKFLE